MNTSFKSWLGLMGLAALLASGCGDVDVLENETTTQTTEENQEEEADIATEETMYDDADKEPESTDHEQEADEDLFDTAELADVSKEEFVEGLKTQLDKLDKQISHLEENSDQIRADVERRWQTSLKALKDERAELAEEYEELKDASDDLWEDFRATVMSSWNQTRVALEKAERDFERYTQE